MSQSIEDPARKGGFYRVCARFGSYSDEIEDWWTLGEWSGAEWRLPLDGPYLEILRVEEQVDIDGLIPFSRPCKHHQLKMESGEP